MLPLRYLFLISVSLLSLLPASSQQAANPLNDLLTMQMNWDASKSNDNAKPSIPLRFVAFASHKQDGKSFTSYHVYAPGLPQNKPFTLITWQIGWDATQPPFQPSRSDLYANARGVVMCRKPTDEETNEDAPQLQDDARLDVIAAGSMGEPIRYALYADNSMAAMGRLVVNPIQVVDNGCHLQTILALGGAEIVLEGAGFAPKSEVELSEIPTTGEVPKTAKFKTDATGRLETAVVLMKKGRMQGTASITMKSDSCAPAVRFQWGHDTYHVQ